ncbi:MAG: hypothetical protein PUB66_01320 [Oscillospiraceae bacterium]|nr:hypothetical protein [Oscillospiraceae bacterium]
MGSFCTSTQVHNPNRLDRDQFINFFCEEMKKNGYVTSNSDESEVSYILRFSDECKWVTLTSESYEQGNQLAQSDAGRIAKMLKTVCINTTVIDSDCATLDLYDKSGKKKDAIIMGRADDYFGDDIPEPIESVWSPLLERGYSWSQLLDVRNGDYVFVEEGLTKIAPIIGMDSEGILFNADSFSDDKRTVSLYFKKTAAKKEKKLTLNAAFDIVFGEALNPLGFKKIKSRFPYYVKCINDEILHIISIIAVKKGDFYHLSIVGGVATIYRKKIDFTINPQVARGNWLEDTGLFYRRQLPTHYDTNTRNALSTLIIPANYTNEALLHFMEDLFFESKEWMIPIIESATDIRSTLVYYYQYQPKLMTMYLPGHKFFNIGRENECLLLAKISDDDITTVADAVSEILKKEQYFIISINENDIVNKEAPKKLVTDALTLKSTKEVEKILLSRSNDNKNTLIECELI